VNRSLFAAAALVLAASTMSGCTMVAHWIWPCPLPETASRLTRETPDDAVDYLIDAFRNRRVIAVYESLAPDFRKENGDFTREDFSLAYERFEPDFRADAESMADADRTVHAAVGGEVLVELTNPSTGAYMPIVLVDRPRIRIVTKNPNVGTIDAPVDMRSLVRLENGRLSLPSDFQLTSIENVSPATAAKLKSEDIVRVEISDDWVVRRIDVEKAKGIRFMDKIKEYVRK
jgi:hypothetical protein